MVALISHLTVDSRDAYAQSLKNRRHLDLKPAESTSDAERAATT